MRFFKFLLVCVVLAGLVPTANADDVPRRLKGVGLLLVDPQFRGNVHYPVLKDPDSQSENLGNIVFRDTPNPTWAALLHEWEEKNPDAGWLGPKVKRFRSVKDIQAYHTQSGLVGVYVYAEEGVWLKTEYGWVNRHDANKQRMEYVTWDTALNHKQLSEFALPQAKEMVVETRVDDIRPHAHYAPIGEVSVLNAPGDGYEIIKAYAPLKLAIVSEEGDWLEVVAVVDTCQATSDGARDYREGTRGWIKKLADGKPTLFRTSGACE